MASVFVRLSVFWNDRQLDVSLPAHRPVQEILDDTVRLLATQELSGSSGTGHEALGPGSTVVSTDSWVLSSPTTGVLDSDRSLAEYGITDGRRLYLTQQPEAAHSPFVDDVMAEVRHTVSDSQWRWSGRTRARGLLLVAAGVSFLILIPCMVAMLTAPSSAPTPADWGATLVTVAVVLGCLGVAATTVSFWRPVPEARWAGLFLPVAAAGVGWPFLTGQPAGTAVSGMVAVVALFCAPAAIAAGMTARPRRWAGAVTALCVAVVAGVVAVASSLGASSFAMLSWSAWLPVLVLLVAPSFAVTSSGLPALLRRNDAGEKINREAIRDRALRAGATTDAAVWTATALGLAVVLVLGSGPYWQQGALAAVLSLVLLLRVSGFSDARLIAPLLTAGAAGLAVTAGSVVNWIDGSPVVASTHRPWWTVDAADGWISWVCAAAVVAVTVVVVLVLQGRAGNEVTEARRAKVVSTIDTFATLAYIPVVLVAQGVFTFYWATT